MLTTENREIATAPTRQNQVKRKARFAGVLYLALFVIAPFAFLIARSSIVVPGDATATAANLAANETLFRVGMVAETAVFLIEIVLAAVLYVIFRPVSRSMSLAAAFARMGEAVVQAVNLLTGAVALLAAGGLGYMAAFDSDQLDAMVLMALDANEFMIMVWGLLFALHLALLGYVAYRSGFVPKVLGTLLMVGSLGYFAESYGNLVAPGSGEFLTTLVMVLAVPGELAFALWLVIKGVDEEKWQQRALVDSELPF